MTKKGPRPTLFVCGAVSDGVLIMDAISANTTAEATEKFKEKYTATPQTIMGPFFKKRTQVLESTATIKIMGQVRKAIYNDWEVNAFLLKEPENQAFLVFNKRVDNKKVPKPQGTIIVPVSDLRFI